MHFLRELFRPLLEYSLDLCALPVAHYGTQCPEFPNFPGVEIKSLNRKHCPIVKYSIEDSQIIAYFRYIQSKVNAKAGVIGSLDFKIRAITQV